MSFAWQLEHWPTVEGFAAHLSAHSPDVCAWVDKIALHHTYRPLPSQWAGERSMRGLERTYRRKGWPSGPHLFIVLGSPDPAHDGIWQGTPLHLPGTHAGACNRHAWGWEIVGDYDHAPWPTELKAFVYHTLTVSLRWLGLPAEAVTGHRECLPNKTCPGRAINLTTVRAELAHRLLLLPPVDAGAITADSAILAPPRARMEQAAASIKGRGSIYSPYDIDRIVGYYWKYAPAVGVDPLLAVAQCIHETSEKQRNGQWWPLSSWWAQRPRRNPAGLGVTGRILRTPPPAREQDEWQVDDRPKRHFWRHGLAFPSWDAGVQAHIGHLLGYALRDHEMTPAQRAMAERSPRLHRLSDDDRGAAKTLRGLNGRWARPGTTYAERIADIARRIQQTKV